MHSNSLELARVALVIIDMQEAFRTTISDFTETAERIGLMVQGARLLNVPIIVTEQYPRGLKHTAAEIKAVLPDDVEVIEKTTFSSCGVRPFEAKLEQTGRKQLLVAGIEAHICINQTVHDLLARGYQVHLLYDCISSRTPQNKQVGLGKMQLSGAIPCSVEMALFELLRDAKHEQFKSVQNLIK